MLALIADNASNNNTLLREFSDIVRTLAASLGTSTRFDSEKAQIRCLAHIIHLAVMELLLGVKAVRPGTSTDDFSPDDLTEEDAEAITADGNREALQDDDDDCADPNVNLASAIEKVCCLLSVCCQD